MDTTFVSVRIALCNFPPFVHADANGTSFYGPWVNALMDALVESVAITWVYLNEDACSHRDLFDLLCTDSADIALHPMIVSSLDRECVEWSYPMDSMGVVLVDDPVTAPQALLFAPFTTYTWLLYAATVTSLIVAMVLLDGAGNRRRHVLRGTMAISGQMDIPSDADTSVYILYATFGIFTMLILSVYTADLTSYLTHRVSQPMPSLERLAATKDEFYVMSGVPELQLEMDKEVLISALGGRYSIVADPETPLRPILAPAMVARRMSSQSCGLTRMSGKELQTLPLGIALRTGFALNRQIHRSIRRHVTSGRLHAEMAAWIRAKYECERIDSADVVPTLSVMWPVFTVAYSGILLAVLVRFVPVVYQDRFRPAISMLRTRLLSATTGRVIFIPER